jgi:hypothetical protein
VVTTSSFVFYDWKAFLSQFYRERIKEISKMHEFQFMHEQPGSVSYKKYHDSIGHWGIQTVLMSSCSIDQVRNPSGSYKSISEFAIDPSTYSLGRCIIRREAKEDISRFQYLKSEIVDHYLCGSRSGHAPLFFENGSSAL